MGIRYALLIGNLDYSRSAGLDTLQKPHDDSNELAALLRTRCGFITRVLHDASPEMIGKAIDEAPLSADLFFLGYSGHGENLGGVNHLHCNGAVHQSFTAYSQSLTSLEGRISRRRPRRVVLLLDACRHGCQFTREPLEKGSYHRGDDAQAYSQTVRLFGCLANQSCYEDSAAKMSRFTMQFCAALESAAPPFVLSTMFRQTRDQMRLLYRGEQIPDILPEPGDNFHLGAAPADFDPVVGKSDDPPLCLAAQDAVRIIAGEYNGLCRWNSGHRNFSRTDHPVIAVAYSVERRTIAYVEGRYPNLFESRAERRRTHGAYLENADGLRPPLVESQEPFSALAFDAGGDRLAVGVIDGWVGVFEYNEEWSMVATLRDTGGEVSALSFSPKGDLYIGLRGGGLRIWKGDPPSTRPVKGCRSGESVISISCLPDREGAAVALAGGLVRILDHRGNLSRQHQFPRFVTQVAYRPDSGENQLAIASTDGRIYLWRPDRANSLPEPFQDCGAIVTGIAFTPDGTALAAGSTCGAVRRWNL